MLDNSLRTHQVQFKLESTAGLNVLFYTALLPFLHNELLRIELLDIHKGWPIWQTQHCEWLWGTVSAEPSLQIVNWIGMRNIWTNFFSRSSTCQTHRCHVWREATDAKLDLLNQNKSRSGFLYGDGIGNYISPKFSCTQISSTGLFTPTVHLL